MQLSYEQLEAAYSAQQVQLVKALDEAQRQRCQTKSTEEALHKSKQQVAKQQVLLKEKDCQILRLQAEAKAKQNLSLAERTSLLQDYGLSKEDMRKPGALAAAVQRPAIQNGLHKLFTHLQTMQQTSEVITMRNGLRQLALNY